MRAIDIAKYLIAKGREQGHPTTNKRLQRLLYYVKVWGTVYFPDGVIDDRFLAREDGPFCQPVYDYYKASGYDPIIDHFDNKAPSKYIIDFKRSHPKDIIKLIDTVYEKYSPLSSMQLQFLSQGEKPWIDARNTISQLENTTPPISEESMKEYYSAKIQ